MRGSASPGIAGRDGELIQNSICEKDYFSLTGVLGFIEILELDLFRQTSAKKSAMIAA
jgi:hypothetical protein